MKWIGQHIIDSVAWFRSLLGIKIGSSDTNRGCIKPIYNGDGSLAQIKFETETTSSTTSDGKFSFDVDGVNMFNIDDYGAYIWGEIGARFLAVDNRTSYDSGGGELKLASNDGSAMESGHRLGYITFQGAEDSAGTRTDGALISAVTDAGWSATENGASLKFYTGDADVSSAGLNQVLDLNSDKKATFYGQVNVPNAGLYILNITTSSATEGGYMRLAANDDAPMGNGHRLGAIEFAGNEGGGNFQVGARIQAMADAAWEEETENGGRLEFYTTDGAATQSKVLALDSDKVATFGGGITFDSVALTAVQTSSESFADNDTSIMTSAAIDDRINTAVTAEDLDVAADSGTAAVDLNSQSLTVTGGTNITTSATGQAVTLNLDSTLAGPLEIEQGASGGAAALLIDNDDTDQIALDIEAANVDAAALRVAVPDLTTANAIYVNADSLTTGSAINLDIDDALTASADKSLLTVNYDKAGVTASGQTSSTQGLEVNMADAATNHASGTVRLTGARINVDSANAQGTIYQKGLVVNVAIDDVGDAATTTGIQLDVMDGANDIVMYSNADNGDYCSIATTTHGATTITTVDDDATAAHFEIAADGDIILDSAGQIKLEPVAGNNILLDGTIAVDAGVVTGATSITSTVFVGDLTGNASIGKGTRHYGSTIKILPSDFMGNEDSAGSAIHFRDPATNTGVIPGDATTEIWAFVTIPEGMTATNVNIYSNNSTRNFYVYEMDVNAAGLGSSLGNDTLNTAVTIDVDATATNFLAIMVDVSHLTNQRLWGGLVTIAPQ